MSKKVADFGEHIGGAKKEWYSGGLSIKDYADMNDAERVKFCTKSKIWKRPKWDKMLEDGAEPIAVFAVKNIYDSIPSKPYVRRSENLKDEQDRYIRFLEDIRTITDGMSTWDEVAGIPSLCEDYGFIDRERSTSYHIIPARRLEGNLNNKLYQALYNFSRQSLEREMLKKQFGVAKEDKIPAGYSVWFYDGNGYSRNKDWKEGTYYVTKGYRIICDNIPDKKTAVQFAQNFAKATKKKSKTRFVPPQLANVERTGLPDVRNGAEVEGNDFVKDFGIRGGEFGNWMSDNDAQESLNMAYDAFYDLSNVIGIPVSKVALNGKLAIAFGARGQGNAVAHYEPEREVINLTKMRGAGSLAHEYFHAIDDIFGKEYGCGGMMTESRSKNVPESVRNVIDTMMWREATDKEKKETAEKLIKQKEMYLDRLLDEYLPDRVFSEEGLKEKQRLVALAKDDTKEYIPETSIGETDNPHLIALAVLKKKETNHKVKKDQMTFLSIAFNEFARAKTVEDRNMRVRTNYYESSKKMDSCTAKEKNGYWSSPCEMFARAGACFVSDELAKKGGRNDYLSGHSESCVGFAVDRNGESDIVKAMPLGEERKAINAAIRKMLDDLFL